MKLCGIDLAWQSEKNPSAIASGSLDGNVLIVEQIHPAVYGINEVIEIISGINGLHGVAIDAPLIINNSFGQRECERQLSKVYSSRYAGCHTSNLNLYPEAKSVYLAQELLRQGFNHLSSEQFQIECYPHPAIIEMFDLPERLKYKKGRILAKKTGQKNLASMIRSLSDSCKLKLMIPDEHSQCLDEDHIDTLRGKALKSNEDALDAILCLYIAGLYSVGADGHTFGDVTSGYVWVPTGSCLTGNDK